MKSITEASPLLRKSEGKVNTDSFTPTKCSSLFGFFSQITAEPVMFVASMCIGVENVFLVNLWVDKECQHLNYSQDVCLNLDSGNHQVELDAVQRRADTMNLMYGHWIQNLPTVFVVIILGAWSDTRGKRMALFLPVFGFFLKSVGILVNCLWWDLSPVYILLAYIPYGFCGGIMGMALGSSVYISAITSQRSRSSRITLLNVITIMGIPTGTAFGTFVYTRYGYNYVFGGEAILCLICMIYILTRLETWPGTKSQHTHEERASRSSVWEVLSPAKLAKTASHEERASRSSVWEVLSPARLAKTASVVFKKRESGARAQIAGHVIIIWFLLFDNGVFLFEFLYTVKKFGWDSYTYTLLSVTKSLMRAVGCFVIMPMMSYWFRVEDSMLGFTGAASYMFQYIITATAPAGWVLYVAGIASCCSDMSFGSSRGALSKLVTEEEVGAVFSIVAMGEALLPLVSNPLFTAVYNATLDVFPGAIFALTSCFFAIICCMYTWMMTQPERPSTNNKSHSSFTSWTSQPPTN